MADRHDQNARQKGQEEALTAPAGPSAAENEQLQQLISEMQPEPELPGLAGDAFDVLGRAAEQINSQRRARGRPPGSANRRNDEVFDYLEARGFKAPELRLMEIISADTRELAAALCGPNVKADHIPFDNALKVLRLQQAAAKELLPYKFAKKSEHNVQVNGRVAHFFTAGWLLEGQPQANADHFSLTKNSEEYQEVNNPEEMQSDKSASDDRLKH